MSWLDAQILRIFLPPEHLTRTNCVEQVLGTIVRPVIAKLTTESTWVNWVWIGRYTEKFADFAASHQVPESYNLNDLCFCVQFRLSIEEPAKEEAKQLGLQLTKGTEYFASKWDDYDVIDDLVAENGNSGNRFVRPTATHEERITRAYLLLQFMNGTVRFMLDALIENDGQWAIEPNSDPRNPTAHSVFEGLHHLFCNTTDYHPPIHVEIKHREDQTLENDLIISTNFREEQLKAAVGTQRWIPLVF